VKTIGNGKRKSKNPCIVVISEKEYDDNHEEDQPLECELQGDDLDGGAYQMLRVKDVTTKWAKNNKLESGLSTIFAQDAEIDDDSNELKIPKGSSIQVCRPTHICEFMLISQILPKCRLASDLIRRKAPARCRILISLILE
jgi:hypothetical protein